MCLYQINFNEYISDPNKLYKTCLWELNFDLMKPILPIPYTFIYMVSCLPGQMHCLIPTDKAKGWLQLTAVILSHDLLQHQNEINLLSITYSVISTEMPYIS